MFSSILFRAHQASLSASSVKVINAHNQSGYTVQKPTRSDEFETVLSLKDQLKKD